MVQIGEPIQNGAELGAVVIGDRSVKSSLNLIQKGKVHAPWRTMIYGTHGIGKSTFGAQAERPIFLPTEDGQSKIDCHKFPLAESFDQFESYLICLATENHDYKTAVVDSADWLEKLIWKEVCRVKNVQSIEDIGFGKGYKFALDWWDRVFKALNYLRSEKGMGCVVIAHTDVTKFEDPSTDNYDRYAPKLHKTVSALLQEWCDDVLFATYKVMTRTVDEGFGKKGVKPIGSGERVLKTTEMPSHYAKNRLGLPPEMPFDYQGYAEYFNK